MDKVFNTIDIIIFCIIGLIVGFVVRLFVASVSLASLSGLFWQFAPWMLLSSALFGVIAYKFPKFASIIVCCIPGCNFN